MSTANVGLVRNRSAVSLPGMITLGFLLNSF
jgi:hypothetical protein